MNLDRETLSILLRIYRRGVTTYGELKCFRPDKPLFELVSVLAAEKAIVYESVLGRSRSGQTGPFICDESKISCTALGRRYAEDYLEKRNAKIAEWVRYIITTAIALAAFIKSFFF